MKVELYHKIASFMDTFEGTDRDCINWLAERYPDISVNTLYSIKVLVGQRKTILNYKNVKENMSEVMKQVRNYRYKRDTNEGIIIGLARQHEIQPTPLARLILKHQMKNKELSGLYLSSDMLKDTTLIGDKVLAYDIFLAVHSDSTNSPTSDFIKQYIGIEYEHRLENLVKKAGLMYKCESKLRILGYDKTPDILLEIPISVDGFIVHWIESKALFADEKNHKQYISDQFESYFNRFGTGLVIYWFGFLDTIKQKTEKFIVKDNLKEEDITKFDPESISVTIQNFSEIMNRY